MAALLESFLRTLRVRWLEVLVSTFVASVLTWFLSPSEFVAPPSDEMLETSTGTASFKRERWNRSLWIDEQPFACRFSRIRGPHGPCLEQFSNSPPTSVTVHWYWHPASFGMRVRMLVSVTTLDGKTLLSPYGQRSQLLAWGATSGNTPPVLTAVFIVSFLATYFFVLTPVEHRRRVEP